MRPQEEIAMSILDLPENLKKLRVALPKLDARSKEFANSLLTQAAGRGLSVAQYKWVVKLIERADAPAPVAPQLEATTVAGLKVVVDMFDKAAEHLKYPHMLLKVNGDVMRLSRAGATAKNPGSVNLTTKGSFEDRIWYGRINRDGTWTPGKAHHADIQAVLAALARDPAGIAAAYGHATSECCFCGIELTDPRSVKMGYGPICAGNYDLPWGE